MSGNGFEMIFKYIISKPFPLICYRYLFIYDISSGYTWTVVKNSAQNYDSVLAFTGIFKGRMYNVETQEYFDMVSTVLPPDGTVICSLTSDYEPELSIL